MCPRVNGVLTLLLIVALTACSRPEKKTANEVMWKDKVAYEIFIRSFADSNGDGIGDIPGMTNKLDYLSELGVDAVWLMPLMSSPSYHKYDVTDYRAIDPEYGTMDDFKFFLHEAHQRGIDVIIDLIINHTSSQHPWFINAKSGPDAKYRDYYIWADKDSVAEQIAKKETSFDSDNITQWHAVNRDTTKEHYYGFFYGGMPDLNYDNPQVRQEIYDIGKFWLEEVGVDGFRMDAAKHIYPDDRAGDNHAFWVEFKSEMEKVKPDVYIVGEVWANTKIQAPFAKGFSALFDFDLSFSIIESVRQGQAVAASISRNGWKVDTSTSFIHSILKNNKIYQSENADYVNAIFLSNHDQNRVMSVLDNDPEKAKMAASIMMTLPGTPYIYYGEELGMKGIKPDPNIREPFLWKPRKEDKERCSWIKPKFSKDSTVNPLSIQMSDEGSIFSHYRKMIGLRQKSKALTLGKLGVTDITTRGLLAFSRSCEGERLIIIHNLSETVKSIENSGYKDNKVYFSSAENFNPEEGIPAMSTVIFYD